MQFARPYFTLFILAITGLILFYSWAFRARKRIWNKFAQAGLLTELLAQVDPVRQKIKAILLILGLVFCFFALLRPQWGFKWQEVKRKGLDIIIALDTSKSMLANDIKPSRLERAKLAIGDFTQTLKGDRIGLIAFAGSAFLECPLTIDYGGFLLSLDSLDVKIIPKGGTSISSAIKEALRSYSASEAKSKVLIIITDGENHEPDPLKLAQEAGKAGVIIHCIGIGTKEGDLIFLEQEPGRKEFLKDEQGNVIKSSLNEELLQKIALASGGTYIRSANTDFGLDLLYREKLSKMEKRELESKLNKLYEERFQIQLAVGFILILLEVLISERKR
jgi:Ca-activated chloride channel family protein